MLVINNNMEWEDILHKLDFPLIGKLQQVNFDNQQMAKFNNRIEKAALWMMEFPHGSWCVLMAKVGVCKVTGIVFWCREDATNF